MKKLLNHQIFEEEDGVALRFKLRAELGGKYGGLIQPASPAAFLSMWQRELERESGRAR